MKNRSYFIFAIAFLILLTALILYRVSFREMNEYIKWVNHTENVIVAFQKLSIDLKSALMLPSDLGKNHKTAILELYKNDIGKIPSQINALRLLVNDNERQIRRVETLATLYASKMRLRGKDFIMDSLLSDSSTNHFKDLLLIQRLIDRGIEEEKSLLILRNLRFKYSARRAEVMTIIFISISILMVVGTAVLYVYQVKERQNLELFLESILNTSESAIITYEAVRQNKQIIDFKIIFANDSVRKQIGMDPAEIMGKTMLDISPLAKASGTFEKCIRVTESGKKDQFETSFNVGNKIRYYNAMLARLNDGFTVTTYDITQLKEYQQELQKKLELLERTNNELEQFAYVASHDLQEPLRKIKTFASLIQDRLNDPNKAVDNAYVSKIMHSANRMSSLISDLLNLSDISAQRESFLQTDLNTVVKNVLNDFELVIEETKASISIGNLPGIEAIPLQMNQLFYNLVNNALKFSSKNVTPQIHITATPLSDQEAKQHNIENHVSYQKITVRDNGIGFNTQFAEKVFIIFQRLHNRKQYSGSGIGLALCKKIALNHHGAIYAESNENEGASFHVILPLIQPQF
ncbi:MAG: ATP-binding protein [Chitinophagaceae bacterium]